MTEACQPQGGDLLDLGDEALYFDETPVPGTEALIAEAAALYGEPEAESRLLRAYFLAPEQLSVLVALYRYYFYQHRLEDTLIVAERAMTLSAERLGISSNWQALTPYTCAQAGSRHMALLRFYLLALKGTAVVQLRLGHLDEARARLKKLQSLDAKDQLGIAALLSVVDEALSADDPTLSIAA